MKSFQVATKKTLSRTEEIREILENGGMELVHEYGFGKDFWAVKDYSGKTIRKYWYRRNMLAGEMRILKEFDLI